MVFVGVKTVSEMKEYTVDELQPLCDGILETVGTFGPNILNLENLQINENNLEKAILIIRVTSSFASMVQGWDECLLKCRKLCKLYGVDENDILYGLIDPSEDMEEDFGEELP